MVRAVLHSRATAVKFTAALILRRAASLAVSGGTRVGVVVQDKNVPLELIFACDRPTSELNGLFTPALVADLRQLKAGVALSTDDLSTERAQVVRMLNSAGIPMIAWLVLPRDEGYYVNADDAPRTKARFEEFHKWTTADGLHWQAVGLDIEPSLTDWTALMGHRGQLLSFIIRPAFDSGRVRRAHDAYAALIKQMQSRRYYVQTYQLEFLADERRAHSTVPQRIPSTRHVYSPGALSVRCAPYENANAKDLRACRNPRTLDLRRDGAGNSAARSCTRSACTGKHQARTHRDRLR